MGSISSSEYPAVESLTELLGETLTTKEGQKKTVDILENAGLILIYFSAHWCPPCRNFTPTLIEFYNTLKNDGKNIELTGI